MTRTAGLSAFFIVAALCQPSAVAGREMRLKDVLSRLDAYLVTYEAELVTLVAEERYEQWVQPEHAGSPTMRRTLNSDFGFLRLPGRTEWLGLRDTFAVDGQPIPDRRDRLERLLSEKSSDLPALARRIVSENSEYNLGTVTRTINVPMLALDLLGRRNRDRFSFRKRSEVSHDGRWTWVVAFNERQHPTMVRTPSGQDRPARGAAWIDPSDGAILRTDLEFDGRGADSPATSLSVLYHRDIALELLVPYEMRELYRADSAGDPGEEIHAVASYTNFRRFRTSARILPR